MASLQLFCFSDCCISEFCSLFGVSVSLKSPCVQLPTVPLAGSSLNAYVAFQELKLAGFSCL